MKNKKGFTLIEFMIVIVIVMLLATMFISAHQAFRDQKHLKHIEQCEIKDCSFESHQMTFEHIDIDEVNRIKHNYKSRTGRLHEIYELEKEIEVKTITEEVDESKLKSELDYVSGKLKQEENKIKSLEEEISKLKQELELTKQEENRYF
jgi:prepilin-type N-terminal cleavage/methylation domain-containing protein